MLANRVVMGSGSKGTSIRKLPIGSIVYDSSWTWEHKTGANYTGTGTTKAVEWIIVAKNHTGYPSNSVTLCSNELIGLYMFDNRDNSAYDGDNSYGYNDWGGSKLRSWLKNTFYNSFSSNFKNNILTTTLQNEANNPVKYGKYTTTDKVFAPSQTELGGGSANTYVIGSNWGYFTTDARRVAKLDSSNMYYWTRSPGSGGSHGLRHVTTDGSFGYTHFANTGSLGVRPALNLKSDTKVSAKPDAQGRYIIL